MADGVGNLNEKLDVALLEFFEKLENLEVVRNDLTSTMRNGFLLMSKARYSMGNKSVGELQYARNMKASTLVIERDFQSRNEDEDDVETDLKGFEVVFDLDKAKNENERGGDVVENEKPGLRQRVTGKDQREDLMEDDEDRARKGGFMDGKKTTDPLKWFGVLVPTSLRECQRDFKTACRLSGEAAQLEQELDTIINDYAKLKEEKRRLQNLSVNTDE
ncbi:coiled-coil domain-containing protein 115-like [Dendronephthya gigantea]|uniref:coiled-coil domain-containing protein 115-like n=1 Tax=Dendronephthya gigantea TaxID=151771 RepID=UPI00106CD08B|nr:coiled-coil domain-containing protein 115-like [Dendronephthya gigantea]